MARRCRSCGEKENRTTVLREYLAFIAKVPVGLCKMRVLSCAACAKSREMELAPPEQPVVMTRALSELERAADLADAKAQAELEDKEI